MILQIDDQHTIHVQENRHGGFHPSPSSLESMFPSLPCLSFGQYKPCEMANVPTHCSEAGRFEGRTWTSCGPQPGRATLSPTTSVNIDYQATVSMWYLYDCAGVIDA
jgi:hypothetical protein